MSAGDARSVLIVLMGAIGDVVRGLPLAARIKREWPQATITWAVEPISRSLVQDHPAIDRVLVFDRPAGFPAYVRFVRELRAQHYDIVLDLQRHFKSGVTALLSGAGRRIGYDKKNAREFNWLFNSEQVPDQDRFSPKILQFQKFGDYLGFAPDDRMDFGLIPTEAETAKVNALLAGTAQPAAQPAAAKRAVLLLGSTWESRLWPAESYRELIGEMQKRWGITAVLVGGKREAAFAKEIAGENNPAVVNLVEQTSLRELVAVFSQSHVAIGSDSGPMHIASATPIPIISLWGSTSPHRSGPWGSTAYMVQSPIGCSPCYRKICPGLGTLCMKSIPAAAVLAQIERLFDEGRLVH